MSREWECATLQALRSLPDPEGRLPMPQGESWLGLHAEDFYSAHNQIRGRVVSYGGGMARLRGASGQEWSVSYERLLRSPGGEV